MNKTKNPKQRKVYMVTTRLNSAEFALLRALQKAYGKPGGPVSQSRAVSLALAHAASNGKAK